MSIPVGVRNVPETPSNTRCETVDACRLLCEHVLRITQFKRFTDVVASEDIRLYVRQLAVDAFISAQVANEQRADKDPALAEIRRDNQLVMLDSLKHMLPAIYVAQKAFHLRAGSVEYWTKLADKALDMANKWYRDDRIRYRYPKAQTEGE